MALTYRTKNENGAGGSGTSVTVGLTGIQAGDVIIAFAGNAGSATIAISDGTSTLTALTAQTTGGGVDVLQGFYLLASVATGSVTYTATFTPAAVSKEVHVFAFSGGSSPSLDTERHDTFAASSTAANSGSITTTGTDEVVVAAVYNVASATVSSPQINSVAADQSQSPGGNMSSWERATTAGFTGSAAATLSVATTWLCNVIAIKNAAGGGRTSKNIRPWPLGMALGMHIGEPGFTG